MSYIYTAKTCLNLARTVTGAKTSFSHWTWTDLSKAVSACGKAAVIYSTAPTAYTLVSCVMFVKGYYSFLVTLTIMSDDDKAK